MQPRDHSQRGRTGTTKLEAYRIDGAFLGRIDLGENIREGAHYTPFLVHDLDGKAEVAARTADGTLDGVGRVIGNPAADHRNDAGYVLEGPADNQPTQPGVYLGDGMFPPPRPKIRVVTARPSICESLPDDRQNPFRARGKGRICPLPFTLLPLRKNNP